MSMYPSIGSTVTNVQTSKTGTAARIEFSDGSSIYVKYEAVVLERPSEVRIRSTTPIVHEQAPVSRVEKHFANLPRTQKPTVKNVYRNTNVQQTAQVVDEGAPSLTQEQLQVLALKAKISSQSRIERLSKPFEENAASEAAMLASLNNG